MHGPEMQEFVREMREQWYGLGPDAIGAVRHSLRAQRDGRLGFQVLASIGVIPSAEERQGVTAPRPETEPDEAARVRKIIGGLTEMAIECALAYGVPLPRLEADLKKVGGRLNYGARKLEPIEAS